MYIFLFVLRDLLSLASVVIFLTTSAAKNIACSIASDKEICYITVKDDSIGGGYFNLAAPRKTLKCINCDMHTLTEIVGKGFNHVVEIIDFSQSHIKSIPNSINNWSVFENIRIFNLSHNEIVEFALFPNVLLTQSLTLTTLDFSYNDIEMIDDDILGKLASNITYLDLSHNKIVLLSSDCFKTARKLQTLKLNNNKISVIHSYVFYYLHDLLHLELSFNAITVINEINLLNLRNLELLKLDNNRLTSIPKYLKKLESLKFLDLSKNSITDLSVNNHSNIWNNHPGLIRLDLSNNHLTDLYISNAEKLQQLNATCNNITSVHLLGLPALEILDLSRNNLTDLDSIEQLGALKECYLAHNKLSSVADITMLPTELQIIDLSFNQLNYINALTLCRFKKLQRLVLQHCGLCSLESTAFAAHYDLRSLDISYNNLRSFNISFKPYLTELFLNGNALTTLNMYAFSFPSLKRIVISAWSSQYLHKVLEQMHANGIEIVVRTSEDTEYVPGIKTCEMKKTISRITNETQLNIVEKVEPKLPAGVESFFKSVTNNKPDYEMILRMFDTQKVDHESVIKTINEFVANHSDIEKIFQQILERQIESNNGMKRYCVPCIRDNDSVYRNGCTSTLVSIWLMGIVNVLLVMVILLLYKQHRRSQTQKNFEENTDMVVI